MSNKGTFGDKIEKAIRYDKVTDTYSVRFNFKEEATTTSFPTLEQARNYRDAIYQEKYNYKLWRSQAIIRNKIEQELKELRDCYPENVFNILNETIVGKFQYEHNNYLDIDKLSPYLEEIVETKLRPGERFVFNGYFKDIKSIGDLGGEIDVTKSRIQQVLKKALYKIKIGLISYDKELQLLKQKEEYEKELKELKEERERFILAVENNEHFTEEQLDRIALIFDLRKPQTEQEELMKRNIEILNLSSRSINCLKRVNVFTVGDLAKLTKHKLVRIRNIGYKSIKEILEKIHSFGIGLVDENQDEIEGYFSVKRYIKDFQYAEV